MTPIPSLMQGGAGVSPGANNFPSEAMMRKIMSEQQQRMNQQQSGQIPDNQQQHIQMQMPPLPFPPDLTEEELQEFLSQPENQPAMKVNV